VSLSVDIGLLEGEVDKAVLLYRNGQPVRAVRSLTAVRRKAERILARDGANQRATAVVARTFMSESAAHFDVTGDLESSLALLAQADLLAADVDDEPLRATILAQRALVVLRSGDTRAALRAFDEAAGRIDLLPVRDRAVTLLNRGALHLERNDLTRAEADLKRAIEFSEAVSDDRLTSMAKLNLGYVDFLAGRLPKALGGLDEAMRVYPGDPHPVMLLDRARVMREAGLVRDADSILEKAGPVLQKEKLFQDLGETELARAECALVEGNSDTGRRLAASAYRRFARRGNVRWQRKAELLLLRCERLAAERKQPHHRRTALSAVALRAEELAEACRREGRRDLCRAATLLGQECRLLAGDEPPAASPVLHSDDPLQLRLQTREVRALAALRSGDTTRAAREVRRGLGDLGAYQHSFGSLDLRTASAVHGSALARLGLDVALRTGSPARVLNLVEHARAVSTRLPSVRPPGDERTAALLSELRQVEEEARSLEGDPAGEATLDGLRDKAVRLQRKIRARAWEIEGEPDQVASEAPRCARVRDAAREVGAAFVSFARHQGRWVAVVICGSRCTVHDLAAVADVSGLVNRVRADLDALAMPHLPEPMRLAVRRSLDLGLDRLDTLLLAPFRMGDRPVVLSCSGDVVFLPWGLLPSRVGLSTVVTPSAAAWLSAATAARPERPRIAALAGPDLRCADREARRVGQAWPGATVLAGGVATAASAHAALVQSDLVHVAAHGRHRHDNPLFSSVRMADGHLYAYEIDAGAGIAGCVVLSACEAGLATLRPGDESLGLAHVLLQLGSKSVIAGVARVGDDVSSGLMTRVHLAMAGGTDSATALAEAQKESLLEASPAAFVSFGATW
jgi:tetratricopeptide (TPR) repeat protein